MWIKVIYRMIIPWKIRLRIGRHHRLKKQDRCLQNKIKTFFLNNSEYGNQFLREIEHAVNKSPDLIPYAFIEGYDASKISVNKDQDKQLFYVWHLGKRLFFPRDMDKENVQSLYNGLLIEQDQRSPHRYLTDDFNFHSGDIVVDVGSAEGMLALELVEQAQRAFLFEPEERWLEALRATFEPYQEKVVIVNKRVSDRIGEIETTIDAYIRDADRGLFIKIDVEGAEAAVLAGASETLKKDNIQIVCCTYHQQDDAVKFETFFRELAFKTEFSTGYMLLRNDVLLKPPFFRKGVIRAAKFDRK